MTRLPLLAPLLAVTSALALTGCNQTEKTTDNALVDVANAVDVNDSAFDDGPLVEDADDAAIEAVTVAAVPKPASGVSAGESAPLVEASDIEEEIRAGTGIERIRHGDGWAWRRDGRILRTADRDGKNVAYFRSGDDRPFFVQRGERSYAYQGDRPVREFARDGRPRAPDTDRVREAEEAAREAREQRRRAEEARAQAGTRPDRGSTPDRSGPDRTNRDRTDRERGDRDRGERGPRPTASPSPSPSATPTSIPAARGPSRRPDWKGDPSPSPQPTDRPRRERERDRDRAD